MKPTETGDSYDKIADKWESDTFDRSNGIPQHEHALKFLNRKGNALDVGCGCNGRIIDLLIQHGLEVEGLDVSSEMITRARKRHPEVIFHHRDICVWDLPGKYDFISAWDSIWHVPLNQQEALMMKLSEALKPGGIMIFTTGGLDQESEHRDANMGPEVYYGTLGIPRTLELLRECRLICRHLEYDQYPEMHLYLIAQKVKDPS